MKKYIYVLLLLLSCSFSYSQTKTSDSTIFINGIVSTQRHRFLETLRGCQQECLIDIERPNIKYFNCIDPYENTNNSLDKSNPEQSTGINGHNSAEDPAIIYPNPVKDIMNIKSTNPITVIEILNLHGEVEQIMDPRQEQLDISNFSAGIYYVRIYFEKKTDVQLEKILIVK